MIYRVLIAEDEPSAARYLRNIVEKKCPGFAVQGVVQNGREALSELASGYPDVLITDIKMPVMSGLDLIKEARVRRPDLIILLVSGYQDFEYAKAALRCGVEDYLLKPVNIEQLRSAMEKIYHKLSAAAEKTQTELLEALKSKCGGTDPRQLLRFFPDKLYDAALIRRGGLPSRFAAGTMPPEEGLRGILPPGLDGKGIWLLSGRDDNELLILRARRPADNAFTTLVRELCRAVRDGYYTAVAAGGAFPLEELGDRAQALYSQLNTSLVIGKNQLLLESGQAGPAAPLSDGILDTTLENKLEFLCSCKKLDELKHELVCLFCQWEGESRPQLWVERAIRRLLVIAGRAGGKNDVVRMELQLDSALHDSVSFGELLGNVYAMVEQILTNCEKQSARVDVATFFDSIDKYVCQNLSQPLTLQSTCAVFGISQTYLSRLFRKYKDLSFNDYVTSLRIQESARLIDEGGEIPIKDVAAIVGYNDPAYFSRVFKSVMGISPSGYQAEKELQKKRERQTLG